MTQEQEAACEKLAQASRKKVVQQVRDLGHYPRAKAGRSLAERQLAEKLCRALEARQFSPEQEAELQALRHASPKQEEELMQQVAARRAEDSARRAEEVIQQLRELGHYPKDSKRCPAERRLAQWIRRARKEKKLSTKQEAEVQALQQEPRDARAQGGDAGTGIRRRPAARNAEEDRRLSRRTDAS